MVSKDLKQFGPWRPLSAALVFGAMRKISIQSHRYVLKASAPFSHVHDMGSFQSELDKIQKVDIFLSMFEK